MGISSPSSDPLNVEPLIHNWSSPWFVPKLSGVELTSSKSSWRSCTILGDTRSSARDLPTIFAEEDLIDEELREKWTDMVGFRNILVHEYVDIDRQTVYDILQNDLRDLEALKRVFARFL